MGATSCGVGGALAPNQQRQQDRGSSFGDDTQIDEGHHEPGVLGGVHQITVQQDGRADSYR